MGRMSTTAKAKTLSDCQHDAVVLVGLLNAIDLMGSAGQMYDSGRIAVTIAALERVRRSWPQI